MGKLKLKYEQLGNALDRLEEAVFDLNEVKKIKNDRLYRTQRDSIIKRFEFCVDLFWKYLKRYLQEEMKQEVEFNAPKPIIKSACKAKLLSEQDAEMILEMIDDRNMSSHRYKEEIADTIGKKIAQHYTLLKKYFDKLSPQ